MTQQELRARVCDQARAWVGRSETDGTHREIIDVYNSIVPLPRGYRMQYNDPWCAGFVSAVARALGLTDWIFPECGCGPMIELYKKAGRWMEDDDWLPEPADVIFYDWQDSGAGDDLGQPDHVGIVLEGIGERITVIEGNCDDRVTIREIRRNGRYIRGYGLPDYTAAAAALTGEESVAIERPEPSAGEAEELPPLPEGWCRVALPVLTVGDESEAVRAAQLLLMARGFSVGWMGADGEFGPKTEAALERFRRSCGLPERGGFDGAAWRRLICKETREEKIP